LSVRSLRYFACHGNAGTENIYMPICQTHASSGDAQLRTVFSSLVNTSYFIFTNFVNCVEI